MFTFRLSLEMSNNQNYPSASNYFVEFDSICRVFNTVNVGARGIYWWKGIKVKQMLPVIFRNWLLIISQETRCAMKIQ